VYGGERGKTFTDQKQSRAPSQDGAPLEEREILSSLPKVGVSSPISRKNVENSVLGKTP
jgi:hypothetical protein